jgi:hypothetical protein
MIKVCGKDRWRHIVRPGPFEHPYHNMCRVSQTSCRPPFEGGFRISASELSTVRVHFSRLCSASTFRGSLRKKQNCRWLTGVTIAKRRRLCSPATRIRQQTAEPQFHYSSPQGAGFHVSRVSPEEHRRHALVTKHTRLGILSEKIVQTCGSFSGKAMVAAIK